MNEQWYREYVLLALRIHKVMPFYTVVPFVDAYYGPAAWQEIAEAEEVMEATDLVQAAMRLADDLPAQHFEPEHYAYLEKLVLALETICRILAGETLSLADEVQRCLDVHAAWIPETQFEDAMELYHEALTGQKNLFKRLQAWRKHRQLPWQYHDALPDIMERITDEIRRRTRNSIQLPEEEGIEIQLVTEKPFEAAHHYLGNFRSQIEINMDALPNLNLNRLVDMLFHEGYPGHHVTAVMQDLHLHRSYGYIEQAIPLVISPQCVIGEGIAMLACEMLFAPDEVEIWLAEHIYPEVAMEMDEADTEKLRRAEEMLEGVPCNAAFLLHEGRPEQEVLEYLARYMRHDSLPLVKDPFGRIYAFTYYYGKQLMNPWLQGKDRLDVFRRFLSEQITPSELVIP